MVLGPLAETVFRHKYSMNGTETWEQCAQRVAKHVMKSVGYKANDPLVKSIAKMIADRKFIPGGRYLYASGRPFHQVQNCLLLRAEDSREGWSDLLHKSSMALMTGAGIGVDYSNVRAQGRPIRRTGGTSTGPLALMSMLNECGRGIMQGGSRRSAIWAGLNWRHPDIHKFIGIKNWSQGVRDLKATDFNFPATLDGTNISVILDKPFFDAYKDDKHPQHSLASGVYWATVRQMLETGEPGLSVDYDNAKESLRNACCEITSADDSDICNLGSINLARIGSVTDMLGVVELATAFLTAGTIYSDVPYAKVDLVRTQNRRLGLGIMGVHEWLLTHGKKYGPDADLRKYLDVYEQSGNFAEQWANEWDVSTPIKTRAVAPTGSIGIIAETTTGIEPIFCTAYKRRYLKGSTWHHQYVVDPTAKKLIDGGVSPDAVEDAYDLARDVERRIEMQAWMQGAVDHAISSTINLPKWGTELNNEDLVRPFGDTLMKYLPKLRGVTVYPDESRPGQPIVPIKYSTAVGKAGIELVEDVVDVCDIRGGGSCGA